MADVAENTQFTDAATAISQGKRHLLVRDYTNAVTVLARACEQLAEKFGDTADELGEPYLLYGRALLGLAREEAGVLGGGVPGSEEAEEDDDGDEDEEADEEKEEEEEEAAAEGANGASEVKEDETRKSESKTDDAKHAEESAGKKAEEDKETSSGKKGEASTTEESNKTDDNKLAEQKAQETEEKEKSVAGSSKESNLANGEASSSGLNGEVKQNGEEDSEDITKEEEEEEVNNLQVAWEVLELAKLVLLKRGPPGWKLLADAYRLLGEVAMEGGNHQGALIDLQGCLDLLQKTEPREPRAIAEIHYQLGLAHSLGNEFDASIEQFNKATTLLETRIKELEQMTEPPKSDDPFYTIEGEIQELKDLLPEIQEKITDMKDFKQEVRKLAIESFKNKVAGGCTNGAGPSSSDSEGSSSTAVPKVQKPASDISHLVRKKRKADEPETEVASPCKKPTPEKTEIKS